MMSSIGTQKQDRRWRVRDLRENGATYKAIVEVIKQEYNLAKYSESQVYSDLRTATTQEDEFVRNLSPAGIERILCTLLTQPF